MQYRSLGSSGLKVSAVGLGTNQLGGKVDEPGAAEIIHRALDVGVNFIDTADVYTGGNSEKAIGKAIRGRRAEVALATKVGSKTGDGPNDIGASRQHIVAGVEASLRRLNTDYIDLYQIHRVDPNTPAEETMRTLDDLVQSGKVRYIGASNYASWQLCHANDVARLHGWTPFASVQPHYHMLERGIESELVPYCEAFNVGIIPYFPLAGGFLTGKYRRGEDPPKGSRGESNPYVQKYFTDRNYQIVTQLDTFARATGKSMVDLVISWLLSRPQVSSVISGATSVAQLESNVKAAGWELSRAEIEQVEKILTPLSTCPTMSSGSR